MQIQISWLLKKPTDLDLHCLQRQAISGFSRTRVNWAHISEGTFSHVVADVIFTTLWANSAGNKLITFFLIFPQKIRFDISCKFHANCMKCQRLLSGKNMKTISKFLLNYLPSMLSVKLPSHYFRGLGREPICKI